MNITLLDWDILGQSFLVCINCQMHFFLVSYVYFALKQKY